MDFKYLRWQVIDTPGVLDHPLEDRNTIEMQSITALAHLRACVLYFVDVSQTCGFTIAQQVSLFSSIKPLFANKPILIVLNKVDLIRPDDMDQADKALLQTIMDEGFEFAQSSCVTDEGVMAVRNLACQKLMALRVEQKMKGQKIGDVLNRLHLASPQQRDEKARPAFIPDTVRARKGIPQDEEAPARRLMRNIELENGGAGVFNVNLKDNYLYKREEWKTDEIPEFLNGKNIADFIDPEIEERLLRLEAEEEALEASGAYDESRFELTPEESEMMTLANKIRQRKRVIQQENRLVGNTSSRPVLVSRIKRKRGLSRNEDGDDDEAHGKSMDIDMAEGPVKKVRAVSRSRGASAAPTRDRSVLGLRANDDGAMVRKVTQLKRIGEKQRNRDARRGEADRRILISRPAHLFSGKRGNGSTDRR
jgi:nucleolar GTP-binding protein